ncbi:MAG: SRPBCC family protein [Gammaproteobacteria bacterium]|nr:SRPBCC family protein [Gammaproteobacteria bacterium]
MWRRWVGVTILFVVGLAAPIAASATTIERLEVKHADNRYTLTFEVVLHAERSKVWQIMTDYEHLPRVSDVIVDSHMLMSADPRRQRVAVTFHACVLIFCKTMKKTLDIQTWPQTAIVVIGDPALSDFSYSVERWRVSAEGANTRLYYTAEMVPNFFIPPLIGPWMVKSFMQKEIKATAAKVEALAKHE